MVYLIIEHAIVAVAAVKVFTELLLPWISVRLVLQSIGEAVVWKRKGTRTARFLAVGVELQVGAAFGVLRQGAALVVVELG